MHHDSYDALRAINVPDLIPVCALPAVHDLQQRLLREAERRLGPRTHVRPIMPVTFAPDSAEMYGGIAQHVGGRIEITLGYIALRHCPPCVLQLAHELVHALDGMPVGHASHLEEGVACLFGADMALSLFERPPLEILPADYSDAWQRVLKIPDAYGAVRLLRSNGISLRNATAAQLQLAAPTVSAMDAAVLCRPFNAGLP